MTYLEARIFDAGFLFEDNVARATPSNVRHIAMKNLKVKGSAMNNIPPMAAMKGTVNWAMPARVAVKCFKAIYQMT